jgi:hypothetical protein
MEYIVQLFRGNYDALFGPLSILVDPFSVLSLNILDNKNRLSFVQKQFLHEVGSKEIGIENQSNCNSV